MNAHPQRPPLRGNMLPQNRASIISVLDIGTSKVCCIIAKLKPMPREKRQGWRSHDIEVLGIGHQLSRGVKRGVVTDMEAAEKAIRAAVDAAERMAGMTVDSCIVNVSCGRIRSEAFSANVALERQEISKQDIQRVLRAGRDHSSADGRTAVHTIPIGYSLDDHRGIQDPRGMIGHNLGVDIHVVSAETAALLNLSLCVTRCHLGIDALVVTPYASGLSSLVEDETALGVLCVDMGGGTTGASIFYDRHFLYADLVALGGGHITSDIARGLSTPMMEAERIKTLFGSALPSASDEREVFSVPQVGDDGGEVANEIPKSVLTGIIKPRLEEIFEMLRDRLNASGFGKFAGGNMVLTGGGGQLTGAREIAAKVLNKQVRIGRPHGISGLPESMCGPAFSAITGLLVHPQLGHLEICDGLASAGHEESASGYLSKVGQWLKESF